MTNITYFPGILRDDASSSVDENSERGQSVQDDLEGVLVQENLVALEAKRAAFGCCSNFARLINLAGSSGLKGESSGSKVQEEEEKHDDSYEKSRSNIILHNQKPSALPNPGHVGLLAAGWPSWLASAAAEAITGWIPRRADSFEKLEKIGEGKFSVVYKAKDISSGKIVALKKVRLSNFKPEGVKFIAREILIMRRLDHPNVARLEGLVTSRVSYSLYLIFEYMEHDLAGLVANPGIKFTLPQVKCYMHQLLSGLEHCHSCGVLHRDIKGSNLLLNNEGMLKIADFGSASFFDPNHKQPMTNRMVTLWYRPPELLLGENYYGAGVDLWSTGCILAELLAGKPIMPGRTEVDQLFRIFKLCGSPTKEYYQNSKFAPFAVRLERLKPYKRCIAETFKDLPPSAISLIETLLAIEPANRQTATAALTSEFFTTEPYACELSSFPQYSPSKEIDARRRYEEAKRVQSAVGKGNSDCVKKNSKHNSAVRRTPAPKVNPELQARQSYSEKKPSNVKYGDANSKIEKFPQKNGVEVGELDFINPGLICLGYYHPNVISNYLPRVSSANGRSGPYKPREGLEKNGFASFKSH